MITVERTLENRLVTYLQTFQEVGDPLRGFPVIAGHRTDDRPSKYVCVSVTASGGDLAYAGIEQCEAQVLVITQADDTELPAHDAAARAVRAIFQEAELDSVREGVNDETFALSAMDYLRHDEARDEDKNRHGTALVYNVWAAELAED